jgi:prohibitin 1
MKRIFSLVFAVFAMAFMVGCSQIDTGNVGVVRSMGKTDLQELPQGVHLTWFATVGEFTTKEVSFGLNDLKPKALDNLTIADLDVDIYFQAVPGMVAEASTKYQGDVVRHKDIVPNGTGDLVVGYNRVSREAREAVYRAVGEFPATTMHTKRAELADRIQKLLQAELDKSDKGTWIVTSVNVRNLVTDPAIEKSIRAAAETDQQIARAKKEEELAKAEANKLREIAKGQADANQIISASLTPALKEIRLAELQRDTALAIAGKAGNTVLMGSGVPLVNVK